MNAERLTLDMELPLSLTPLREAYSDMRLNNIDIENERILNALISMQLSLPQSGDPEMDRVLQHMDTKLNLILELVGRVSQQHLLPEPQEFGLNADFLYLQQCPADVGSMLEIEVYLNPNLPMKLRLIGELDVSPDSETGHYKYSINFGKQLYKARDLLERYIFLQHRREFAYKRHKT